MERRRTSHWSRKQEEKKNWEKEEILGHMTMSIHKGESLYCHTPTKPLITHPLTTHPPTHHPLTHSPPTHSPPTHPHLSVFKDKQPRVVPGPLREAHMVNLISVLAHTKVEPCKRTETQQSFRHLLKSSSSQHQMLREGESKLKKACLDRQGQEVHHPTQPAPPPQLLSSCSDL